MMTKSKVRQSALVLIYAVLENGGDTATFDFDLFWSIAQEKEQDRYTIAEARAIDHICRPAQDAARLLAERVEAVHNAMDGDMTTARLREDIERYARQYARFASDLVAQQRCLTSKRRETTDELAELNRNLLHLARAVDGLGADLLPLLADFPAYRNVLESLGAAIRRQSRMLSLCAGVENPASLAGTAAFAPLVRSANMLAELRPAAEELALAVLARRAEYDARIAERLENYSPERLDVVDKGILYLALYELEENGLTAPIVISEATSLANEYSGAKSAPFIHGVLAALIRKD